jgi:hypothetical protein
MMMWLSPFPPKIDLPPPVLDATHSPLVRLPVYRPSCLPFCSRFDFLVKINFLPDFRTLATA